MQRSMAHPAPARWSGLSRTLRGAYRRYVRQNDLMYAELRRFIDTLPVNQAASAHVQSVLKQIITELSQAIEIPDSVRKRLDAIEVRANDRFPDAAVILQCTTGTL